MPVSTPPTELPPPPEQRPGGPTYVAGQQSAPSTIVPHGPDPSLQYAAAARTNSLAIVSLICGIGSFVAHIVPGVGGFTVALIAVVTGYMARNQIRQSGEQGMGMATAGMIIGIVHIGLIVGVVLVLIFLIFVVGVTLFGIAAHGGGASPSPVVSGA